MTASAQKKTEKKTAATSTETTTVPQTSALPKMPALVAFHVTPAPKGQQPILTPIGAAMAHDDGEGYTLQLNLIPTTGGRIVLRVPKAKKATS